MNEFVLNWLIALAAILLILLALYLVIPLESSPASMRVLPHTHPRAHS